MSNTEKIIKELQNIKETREAKSKSTKPAVRIQQLKNNLIILAHARYGARPQRLSQLLSCPDFPNVPKVAN
jgi:hypothetical protein